MAQTPANVWPFSDVNGRKPAPSPSGIRASGVLRSARMTSRDFANVAAALALVGWYLMTPPLRSPGGELEPDAPIARWRSAHAYDSAGECEKAKESFIKSAERETSAESDKLFSGAILQSQCVASDDPRLGR
jgi:hypothetical protein